jgi:hypothetical protein
LTSVLRARVQVPKDWPDQGWRFKNLGTVPYRTTAAACKHERETRVNKNMNSLHAHLRSDWSMIYLGIFLVQLLQILISASEKIVT